MSGTPTPRLRRALTLRDLVVYGMVMMVPIAPFSVFGYVHEASQGRAPLAYMVGLVAMLFSALSYSAMAEAFPVAGSAFSYVQRGLHPVAGFFAGWLLLLDYILVPALLYVVCANSLVALFPVVPKAVWVAMFIIGATAGNLRGVELTARANHAFLAAQVVVLGLFLAVGLRALLGTAGGGLTLAPINPQGVNLQWVAGAAALAALSFLGFDGIATLAEETRGGSHRRIVGQAMLIVLFAMGAIFMVQTWVATDLAHGMTFKNPDTAFYDLARHVGGPALFVATALGNALAAGLANALAAQSAVSRVLYAMGRERALPGSGWLSTLHPVHQTPRNSTLLVALLSVGVSAFFIDRANDLAAIVTFGALCAFGLLHVACAWHFLVRQRSGQWLRHGVVPLVGLVVLVGLLDGQDRLALKVGGGWLLLGAAWLLVARYGLGRRLEVSTESA